MTGKSLSVKIPSFGDEERVAQTASKNNQFNDGLCSKFNCCWGAQYFFIRILSASCNIRMLRKQSA